MKINMNVNRVVGLYNQSAKGTQSNIKKQNTGDKIEISSTGKEISRYIELAKDTEIRNSKVEEIKTLLSQNNYNVDSKKLAESILKYIKESDN